MDKAQTMDDTLAPQRQYSYALITSEKGQLHGNCTHQYCFIFRDIEHVPEK